MKCNDDIRQTVQQENLYLWQVGMKLGMQDSNFSRLLRRELDTETKARIYCAIDLLKEERERGVI